jgi:hypothetical protein
MSKELIQSLHSRLAASNYSWPREAFSPAEQAAQYLEHRLARVVGQSDIEFCHAVVDEDREKGTAHYTVVLFTRQHVVRGEIHGSRTERAAYPPAGDVTIVPRSGLKSLTLHHVEYFDEESRPDHVEFSAAFENLPLVHIGRNRFGESQDEGRNLIFDALQEDLVRAATEVR